MTDCTRCHAKTDNGDLMTNTTEDESRKVTPERLRKDFYRIAIDWVYLRTHLPKPIHNEQARRSTTTEYGHPAEWASDLAARIADTLTDWHSMLAETRNETPPATRAGEQHRVVKAWQYLEPRVEQLIQLVEPEAFAEINDIHWQFKRNLGYTNPTHTLPTPCPNYDCEGLRTLQRKIAVGNDIIECGVCGYTVQEQYYPLFARMILDTLLDEAV